MLSMRRVRLAFSNALSMRSWAMERFAIRARRTGRHATKRPLTCERAEDSSRASPSGVIVEASVSFRIEFWSFAAAFWSSSIVLKNQY